MTFWIILAILCLFAVLFTVWPLWKSAHRLTPLVATVTVCTVALAAGLYDYLGSPGVPSGRGTETQHSMQEAIAALQSRLDENPDDVEGWKLLGRSYMSRGDFAAAVTAYENAVDLETGQNAQTMVDLAAALLNRDGPQADGRTASLLDSALALEPNNPGALFYSGIVAADRGDTDTAAARWEVLLGLNPPANIRPILEQRLAEWRGEPVAATPRPAADSVPADAIFSARVALSDDALDAMTSDATVFIIARDPAAPSPPIAVMRRSVSQLPAVVSFTDADSMMAGRTLSAFGEIEVLARVSLSGSPAAQSGDWFASQVLRPADSNAVSLTIDKQVP